MKTAIALVLDCSASMRPLSAATIKAFNQYISSIKEEAAAHDLSALSLQADYDGVSSPQDETLFSLTVFNHIVKTGPLRPIETADKLYPSSYVCQGSTALYDAIRAGIQSLTPAQATRYLVVTLTDGEENASVHATREHILDLITEKQARGNWTFVYLGANQDAWQVGHTMGFHQGNTMTYDSSEQGIAATAATLRSSTQSYYASPAAASMDFLSQPRQVEPEPETDAVRLEALQKRLKAATKALTAPA